MLLFFGFFALWSPQLCNFSRNICLTAKRFLTSDKQNRVLSPGFPSGMQPLVISYLGARTNGQTAFKKSLKEEHDGIQQGQRISILQPVVVYRGSDPLDHLSKLQPHAHQQRMTLDDRHDGDGVQRFQRMHWQCRSLQEGWWVGGSLLPGAALSHPVRWATYHITFLHHAPACESSRGHLISRCWETEY